MTIDQTITEYSGPELDKDTMSPDEFDAAAQGQVDHLNNLAPEINTWAQQANALAASANDIVSALAAANFKGSWASLSGALDQPACVYHVGQYWMLATDLADVTASEPADDNGDWILYPAGVSIVAKAASGNIAAAEMRGNMVISNTGAAGDIQLGLPARSGDYRAEFLVDAAHYLKIVPPSGESIRGPSDEETAVDGYIRSNTPGTRWVIVGSAAMVYTIVSIQGTILVDA